MCVMIEHFDSFQQRHGPHGSEGGPGLHGPCGDERKFVVLKWWPRLTSPKRKYSFVPTMRISISPRANHFPLGVLLDRARPGCHFCYSWGYREDDGGLNRNSEFDRPLGRPDFRCHLEWHDRIEGIR